MTKAEDFKREWKNYCDAKGGGAVTINIRDAAEHFAAKGYEQAEKDFMEKAEKVFMEKLGCLNDGPLWTAFKQFMIE